MDKKYTCGICGKSYDNIEDRIKCETKCVEERKKYEAERKKNEAEAKRKNDTKKVYDALNNAENALHEYYKEHNSLTLNEDYTYLRFLFSRQNFWF